MAAKKFTPLIFLCFFILLPTALHSQSVPESRMGSLQALPEYQWMQAELASKWSQLMLLESAGPQEVDVAQYTLEIEFFPEPEFFYFKILEGKIKFVFQQACHPVGIKHSRSDQLRKFREVVVCILFILPKNCRGNRIYCVKRKMGIQLVAY